ncbi:MAG: hypothetical protein HY592_03925 [Candidatus Omnitrophica bacterium]|nr:hypothetical protein [Candidatus Omnitrophota bacterium]
MKKTWLASCVFLLTLAVLGAAFLYGGLWDVLFSQRATSALGFPIKLAKARPRADGGFAFESLTLMKDGREAVRTGAGEFYPLPAAQDRRKGRLVLSDIKVNSGFFENTVFRAADPFLSYPLKSAKAEFLITSRQGVTTIHVLRFSSEEVSLRGGFSISAGRILRAHTLFSLSENLWHRLPEEFASNAVPIRGMPRAVRVIFGGSHLEVRAGSLPFFRAEWRMV